MQSNGLDHKIPALVLSREIMKRTREAERKIRPSFMKPITHTSDFYHGRPKYIPQINRPTALAAISNAALLMMRMIGFDGKE